MKHFLTFLLALVALAFTGPAHAEVITKGGAILLRPQPRETANFAFTNGAANPGLPLILRVSTWQSTNHWGITTNGAPAFVQLGTNFVGFTGTVTNGVSSILFFKHGMLVTTNNTGSVVSP